MSVRLRHALPALLLIATLAAAPAQAEDSPVPPPPLPPPPPEPPGAWLAACAAANVGELSLRDCVGCWPASGPVPVVPFVVAMGEAVACLATCTCEPPGPVVGLVLVLVAAGDAYLDEVLVWLLSLEPWAYAVGDWAVATADSSVDLLLCVLVGPGPCTLPPRV